MTLSVIVPDRLLGHLRAIHLGQMGADLTSGQALRRQRQHHVLHTGQAALPLAHDLRLETAITIAGHVNRYRADLGQHRLTTGAVTTVATIAAGRIVLVVAQVVGDLTLQRRLQHPLGQLLQQPTLTGQLQSASPNAVQLGGLVVCQGSLSRMLMPMVAL